MFRPITVWPFPNEQVSALADRVKSIIMVEHNYGQMLREVERNIKGRIPVEFIGRINGTVIPPEEILEKIQEVEKNAK